MVSIYNRLDENVVGRIYNVVWDIRPRLMILVVVFSYLWIFVVIFSFSYEIQIYFIHIKLIIITTDFVVWNIMIMEFTYSL